MLRYLILAFLILISPSQSFATIDIVPQKIIIESRERGGQFTILNLFNQPGTFRINLLSYKQNEQGVYTKLETPLDPKFNPEKVVRFSPRQFSLSPGGRQKVRLSIRKPADLPEGEYRFHVQAYRFANKDDIDENAVSVLMNTGVVIPVIVRHGKTEGTAKIGNTRIINKQNSTKKELELDISRSGTASTIGKIEVLLKHEGKDAETIGEISNANIFTDITKRQFKIPLKKAPPANSKLLVRYYNDDKKDKIFDEMVINY